MSELSFPADFDSRPGRRVLINDGLVSYITGAMAALERSESWISESDYSAAYKAIGDLYIAMSQLETANPNTVLAGPSSGAAAPATFRQLAPADIPALPAAVITSGVLPVARGGTGADLSATGSAYSVVQQKAAGDSFYVAPLVAAHIPNLPASILTSGVLPVARGGTGASTKPNFRATKNGISQNGIAHNTFTKVTYSTVIFDATGAYANSRFTPAVDSVYQVTASLRYTIPAGGTDGAEVIIAIYRNGSEYARASMVYKGLGGYAPTVNCIVPLGVSDYVEIWTYQSTGSTQNLDGYAPLAFFTACKL